MNKLQYNEAVEKGFLTLDANEQYHFNEVCILLDASITSGVEHLLQEPPSIAYPVLDHYDNILSRISKKKIRRHLCNLYEDTLGWKIKFIQHKGNFTKFIYLS